MSEHGLNSFRAVSERLGAHVGGVKAGLGEVPRDFEAENPKRGWDRVWQRVVGEVSGAESLLHSSINCDRRSLLGGKGGSKAHVEVSEREGSDRITLSVRANENVEEVVAAMRGEDSKSKAGGERSERRKRIASAAWDGDIVVLFHCHPCSPFYVTLPVRTNPPPPPSLPLPPASPYWISSKSPLVEHMIFDIPGSSTQLIKSLSQHRVNSREPQAKGKRVLGYPNSHRLSDPLPSKPSPLSSKSQLYGSKRLGGDKQFEIIESSVRSWLPIKGAQESDEEKEGAPIWVCAFAPLDSFSDETTRRAADQRGGIEDFYAYECDKGEAGGDMTVKIQRNLLGELSSSGIKSGIQSGIQSGINSGTGIASMLSHVFSSIGNQHSGVDHMSRALSWHGSGRRKSLNEEGENRKK